MMDSSSMARQGSPKHEAGRSALPNVRPAAPELTDRLMLGTVGVRLEEALPKLVFVDLDAEAGAIRDGPPSSG